MDGHQVPGSHYIWNCWWKKSCTTQHAWNLVNNGIFTISTGDRRISEPSTEPPSFESPRPSHQHINRQTTSQLPWPLQQLCTEQSVPLKPAKHKQPPSIQRPWPRGPGRVKVVGALPWTPGLRVPIAFGWLLLGGKCCQNDGDFLMEKWHRKSRSFLLIHPQVFQGKLLLKEGGSTCCRCLSRPL